MKRKNSGESSPKYVLAQLDEYKNRKGINSKDELCMVIDKDQWTIQELSDVARKCDQKQYVFAVSNPSIEIWLLLHFKCMSEFTGEERREINNYTGQQCKALLSDVMGVYNPANLDIESFWDHTHRAIERARLCDTDNTSRWPAEAGTRVYLILEKILSRIRE